MSPIKRPLAAAGSAVLLAFTLAACGGGAPTDASKEDFCDAVNSDANDEEFTKALEDKDGGKLLDLIQEQVDEIEEVGTPEDISDDEREGFEILLEQVDNLSEDDIEQAINDQKDPFEADLSSDEKKKVDAYNKYETETCS